MLRCPTDPNAVSDLRGRHHRAAVYFLTHRIWVVVEFSAMQFRDVAEGQTMLLCTSQKELQIPRVGFERMIDCIGTGNVNWRLKTRPRFFRFLVNQTGAPTSFLLRTRDWRSLRRIITNAERTGTMTSTRLSTKHDYGCLGGFAYEQANRSSAQPGNPLRL